MVNNDAKIDYIYDGEGSRVIKSIYNKSDLSITITRYLTDTQNPTGYVQVLEELNGAYGVAKRYTYGHDLISQTDVIGTAGTQYYGYDGIGSTRLLTNEAGAVSDSYDYDAFGTIVYSEHLTPSTDNRYLFHGEQFDADLGQYYLRARYMSPGIGRFWTLDEFEGFYNDPTSLHKYIFVANNSINYIDPNGDMFLIDVTFTMLYSSIARVKELVVKAPIIRNIILMLTPFIYSGQRAFYHFTNKVSINSIKEGIDISKTSVFSRFGQGFYMAEQSAVAVAEGLTTKVAAVSQGALLKISVSGIGKVLDLTKSNVVNAVGYIKGVNDSAIGAFARKEGYDAIRYFSDKVQGGINWVLLNQETIIKVVNNVDEVSL